MATQHSRLTAQGQISVPAAVRRRLGLGPGSVLEWEEHDGAFIVRRAGRRSSAEIHKALFAEPPARRTGPADVKEGIRTHIRRKHARD